MNESMKKTRKTGGQRNGLAFKRGLVTIPTQFIGLHDLENIGS